MTTALQRAFALIPEAGTARAYSAKDIEARSPVPIANARALTTTLRSMGKITEAHRLGGEKFYVRTPGATAPDDARRDPARLAAARLKRQKRLLAKRARQMRRAKRGGA